MDKLFADLQTGLTAAGLVGAEVKPVALRNGNQRDLTAASVLVPGEQTMLVFYETGPCLSYKVGAYKPASGSGGTVIYDESGDRSLWDTIKGGYNAIDMTAAICGYVAQTRAERALFDRVDGSGKSQVE